MTNIKLAACLLSLFLYEDSLEAASSVGKIENDQLGPLENWEIW